MDPVNTPLVGGPPIWGGDGISTCYSGDFFDAGFTYVGRRFGLHGLVAHVVVWEGAGRVGSRIESPWRNGGGFASAQLLDHGPHVLLSDKGCEAR